MRILKQSFVFAALAFAWLAPFAARAQTPVRTVVDFNADWKSVQGDPARAGAFSPPALPGTASVQGTQSPCLGI